MASTSSDVATTRSLIAPQASTTGGERKTVFEWLLERIHRWVKTSSSPPAQESPEFTLKYQVPNLNRSLDDYDAGYAKVASFEDADPNFLIYRKFGWLHNRVLLHTQDELQAFEEQLERLDKSEALQGDERKLRSRRIDENASDSPRKALIVQIKAKLKEYDETLLRLQKKQAIKTPTKRNQNSLYNLIQTSGSLSSSEASWIRRWDDLAAIAHNAENGWFNGALEDILRFTVPKISMAIFRTKEQKIRTGSQPSLMLVSPERLDIFLRIVLTILASALLLVPVLILVEIQPSDPTRLRWKSRYQVATIFVSTLIFSASCSIFTKARRQEVFTATAAYCAVLVVFLGNNSNTMVVPTNGA